MEIENVTNYKYTFCIWKKARITDSDTKVRNRIAINNLCLRNHHLLIGATIMLCLRNQHILIATTITF